jgi:WD40 repeat protein
MLATAGEDKTVRFWDAATGVELESNRWQHAVDVTHVAWSRDGIWVASCDNNGLVKLRNLKTQSDWTLRGHSQSVKTLRFALDSGVLISASLDRTIRFWDLTRLPPNDVLPGRTGSMSYSPIAFSADGQSIATVDPNATDILLWGVATGAHRSRFSVQASDLRPLLSPDAPTITSVAVDDLVFVSEDRLAVACSIHLNSSANPWCYRIALYDLQSQALVDGFSGRVPLQLSPDGERLAMQGEAPGSVRIHDLGTGRIWPEPSMAHPLASTYLGALAFSPDGSTLAVSVEVPGAWK